MAYHHRYTRARDWRSAVRDIRQSLADEREAKRALASWWQEHRTTGIEVKTLYEAYRELLGPYRVRRFIG